MKLSDLNAVFLKWYAASPSVEERAINPQWPADHLCDYLHHGSALAEAHGIRFICPKGFAANQPHEVVIFFSGSPVPDYIGRNKKGETVRWKATGTGLDDLTLTPSIQEQCNHCEWHGFVTNGSAE
jgi:hypothetical protein